jgi:hypothetical protein
MITETMVLIALKQKNWIQAESMSGKIVSGNSSEVMKVINGASKVATERPDAAYLLSLWAQIRWNEINDDEDFI